ncbi:DNA recombination protein [Salmonella enterica subsp. enterica serovar Muenchen]|nr:DNA recombination protein [Salmonella enterica subsp. enterica serovar Muenchen]ECZ7909643.1 DNA recombination protein [Salmonella enterica subsp. enterica serovar Muenchen]
MMSSAIPVALFDRLLNECVSPRESVCRELVRLFNIRAPQEDERVPALLIWGVPEWHNLNVIDERVCNNFCRQLRCVILRVEPRIVALAVIVKKASPQTLALHIDAQLWNDTVPLMLDIAWRNGHWQLAEQGETNG